MNYRVGLAIVIAVVSVLAGASAQLDPIFGATVAKTITSACSLLAAILASVMSVVSTQGSTVNAVQNMGARIVATPDATPLLAQMAQPNSGFPNVVPEKGKEDVIKELAKQA